MAIPFETPILDILAPGFASAIEFLLPSAFETPLPKETQGKQHRLYHKVVLRN